MDIIKQLMEGGAAMLAKVLTGKNPPENNNLVLIHEELSPTDLHMLIFALFSERQINSAENLLFEFMEKSPSEELYKSGAEFFRRVSELSDEELVLCDYTRREIEQGKNDLKKLRPLFTFPKISE